MKGKALLGKGAAGTCRCLHLQELVSNKRDDLKPRVYLLTRMSFRNAPSVLCCSQCELIFFNYLVPTYVVYTR